MSYENPFLSKEGFEYINSIKNRGCSKTVLEQILNSLVEPFHFEVRDISGHDSMLESNKRGGKQVKQLRKEVQFRGIVGIVKYLGNYNNILEVGCGNGRLARNLALDFPESRILGIERDPNLVFKARRLCEGLHNTSFEERDAFEYHPSKDTDLVVSLHGCGNLTDKVIDFAVNAEAEVICVPCCYGNIKRKSEQKGNYFLPRSETLRDKREFFRNVVLKRASKLEGSVDDRDKGIKGILRDIYRVLVNFDRLLYLMEHDYEVRITKITESCVIDSNGSKHLNSSLRHAIIGKLEEN